MRNKNHRKAENKLSAIKKVNIRKNDENPKRFKKSDGIGVRTSSIAIKHYTKEVRWDIQKLKREVTWVR